MTAVTGTDLPCSAVTAPPSQLLASSHDGLGIKTGPRPRLPASHSGSGWLLSASYSPKRPPGALLAHAESSTVRSWNTRMLCRLYPPLLHRSSRHRATPDRSPASSGRICCCVGGAFRFVRLQAHAAPRRIAAHRGAWSSTHAQASSAAPHHAACAAAPPRPSASGPRAAEQAGPTCAS